MKAASYEKAERIVQAGTYKSILRKGSFVEKRGIALYYCKRVHASDSRLGILVSRKSLAKAVARNRLKRIIREYFRTKKRKLKSSFDLVFRTRLSYKPLKNNELRQTIDILYKQAGILFHRTD